MIFYSIGHIEKNLYALAQAYIKPYDFINVKVKATYLNERSELNGLDDGVAWVKSTLLFTAFDYHIHFNVWIDVGYDFTEACKHRGILGFKKSRKRKQNFTKNDEFQVRQKIQFCVGELIKNLPAYRVACCVPMKFNPEKYENLG